MFKVCYLRFFDIVMCRNVLGQLIAHMLVLGLLQMQLKYARAAIVP